LKLIVDNAHAFGVKAEHEDFSCFSFQAIKALTAGDGGLIVCKERQDYENGKRLRWFGIDRQEAHTDPLTGERVYNLREVGYKYHMNDISAAIGLGNINRLVERHMIRLEIAEYYDQYLSKFATFQEGSTRWLYTLLVKDRNNFVRMMNLRGIPVSVVHLGIHKNDVFGLSGEFHVQDIWDKEHICIPCHPKMKMDDAERVVEAVQGGW
jgi:perosamine synthetase